MVTFEPTMGGLRVIVNGDWCGYIDKEGFFTEPTVVQHFIRMSPADLRDIADKATEYVAIRDDARRGRDVIVNFVIRDDGASVITGNPEWRRYSLNLVADGVFHPMIVIDRADAQAAAAQFSEDLPRVGWRSCTATGARHG